MADDDFALGDDWSRLVSRLKQKRQDHADTVLAGGLTPTDYTAFCARITQIDETMTLISDIRSGRDRAPKTERLRLPEENDSGA